MRSRHAGRRAALGRTLTPWMGRSGSMGHLKSFRCVDERKRRRTRAIPRSTSTGTAAQTPISRRPIPRRCSIGQRQGSQARISATCCWTIDRGLSPTSARPTRYGDPRRSTRTGLGMLEARLRRAAVYQQDKGYECNPLPTCKRPGRHATTWRRRSAGVRSTSRTTRHACYPRRSRKRKLLEQVFGLDSRPPDARSGYSVVLSHVNRSDTAARCASCR